MALTRWLFGGLPDPAEERTQAQAALPAAPMAYGRVVGAGTSGAVDTKSTWKFATSEERKMLVGAYALALITAALSIDGLITMFPGAPVLAGGMGVVIEWIKFWGLASLAGVGRRYSFVGRNWVAVSVIAIEILNLASVNAALTEAHVGPAAARQAQFVEKDSALLESIRTAAAQVADDENRLQRLARIGAMDGPQRREYLRLLDDLDHDRRVLGKLRSDRAIGQARNAEHEAENAPMRYTAQLLEQLHLLPPGVDPETVARWIILVFLFSGDPTALGIVYAINSRRRKRDRAGFYRRS